MDSKQEVEVEMEQERERGIVVVCDDTFIGAETHRALLEAAHKTGSTIYVGNPEQIPPLNRNIIEGATLTINGKMIGCPPRIVGNKQSPTKSLCSKLNSGEITFSVSDSDQEILYQFALRSRCIPGEWKPIINQHGGKGKGDRIRRRKQFMPQKSINKGRK
ncbi:hypothetical protein VPDG_00053 [Vibrio phage henriette 12B8]|uniref:hypothetical protein n=1 Tax=Vibrio phage henriette 12B8 TaxID=573174 RepID=UPI0002C0EB85|nr:hypothetical protein VPDG_00053 [Vibrio phage henriette 12B8]AGG58214.1 hypothetical protein VPDG_00053 [Vibrio phage henriette 12B8]